METASIILAFCGISSLILSIVKDRDYNKRIKKQMDIDRRLDNSFRNIIDFQMALYNSIEKNDINGIYLSKECLDREYIKINNILSEKINLIS